VTASLPVPNDIDPEEPDGHGSAPIVSLPSGPKAASAERVGPRKPPRKKTSKSKRETSAPREDAADPRVESPGPPPPLPADLQVAGRAAADIVVPPKPPLPEVEETEETEDVEPEVIEPEVIEPEPETETALADDTPEVLTAPVTAGDVLVLRGVSKRFGDTHAVDGIDLTVPAGTFYGLVGPNGAGKTTTLSMIAGLLEPDRGSIRVADVDAASDPLAAKRVMGVLPDRLRTFDRLTGRQLLYYYGVLRGLAPAIVESRTADLARAFDLTDALGRVVSDYSAGMVKKVMLAGALIHSPRLLVLDEPFEAVDPVSSAIILDILSTYVAHGGTVILSSHGMDLVERVCSRVAVIVAGQVLAEGTIDEVRGELSLEQRFIELAGGLSDVEGLEWLHTFSD
jgi:ABC-2 type transport system ATP-binding protein